MRKIIPFKKELLLKTKVYEITSISLEHKILEKEKDKIKGEFYITGDYKITKTSINREKFNYTLPFEIEIDKTYKQESINIDIDNFYYEIINDEGIKVNIDLFIEGEKEEENLPDISIKKEPNKASYEEFRKEIEEKEEVTNENNEEEKEEVINENNEKEKEGKIMLEQIESVEEEKTITTPNILKTDSFAEDTYVTYYVYIVKEEDTLDKIIQKFNVTKESIEDYNDIKDIKPGTKLIIPSPNE